MRHLIQKSGVPLPSFFFALFLSISAVYTYKIDKWDRMGDLSLPGHSFLAWWDVLPIAGLTVLLLLVLPFVVRTFRENETAPEAGAGLPHWPVWAFAMWLFRLPFLLALYPAPGMNDTVFMMDNPLYASVQFPWFYSLVYGGLSQWGQAVLGSREPVIFALSLLEAGVMSAVLTAFASWLGRRAGRKVAIGLYLYFLFFPMVGNYSIAAVRDGLFSTGLLLWMWLFLSAPAGQPWTKRTYALWAAASFLTLLFRNNGLFIAVPLTILLAYRYHTKKLVLLFLLSAAIAIVPGQVIRQAHHWEPLFQESMAIPLQQMGRVLVMEGDRMPEAADFMDELLPAEKWKKGYSPYTVDFVKWHDDFRRNWLNDHKKEFLLYWGKMGLSNPRLYVEGALTETYALWNLDPLEYHVQSRFGWALTDENTKNMKPADNDRMVVGDLPLPMSVKSFLANWTFEGSRFLGAGFSLWLTLFFCLLFYNEKIWTPLYAAAPLLLNTLTLLLSTPASAVFRYSFAYVLGLPVLAVYVFLKQLRKR